MMKGLRLQLFEIENEILNYNKVCLKRDMDMLSKLPEERKVIAEEKLRSVLKEKIMEDVADRYVEILPQCNLRILDVIELIESSITEKNNTIKRFKKNMFI